MEVLNHYYTRKCSVLTSKVTHFKYLPRCFSLFAEISTRQPWKVQATCEYLATKSWLDHMYVHSIPSKVATNNWIFICLADLRGRRPPAYGTEYTLPYCTCRIFRGGHSDLGTNHGDHWKRTPSLNYNHSHWKSAVTLELAAVKKAQ